MTKNHLGRPFVQGYACVGARHRKQAQLKLGRTAWRACSEVCVLGFSRSNRMERLVTLLIERLEQAPARPMAPEHILVHSSGMEAWLSQNIAAETGIAAGLVFPFPRAFLFDTMSQALGLPDGHLTRYGAAGLQSAVLAALPGLLHEPRFRHLRPLCGPSPERAHAPDIVALSRKLAVAYDRVMADRPALCLEWDAARGSDIPWQAVLWQRIVRALGGPHPVQAAHTFVQRWQAGDVDHAVLPPRLSVFGATTLPRLYMDLFARIAEAIDVHFYVLSATPHYVGDVVSPKLAHKRGAPGIDAVPQLLAANGRVGREFLDVLVESGADEVAEAFVQPADDHVLGRVQRDLYDVSAHADGAQMPLDTSLSVHAAAGARRQVEVLRDDIVQRLARDATLRPEHIVVMTPDIETFGPLLSAALSEPVDGPDATEPVTLRHRVVDGATLETNPAAQTLLAALRLLDGRFEAPDVLDFFARPLVKERLGTDDAALELFSAWSMDAGARWGLDGAHRDALHTPRTDLFTWRFGLDRLLLGAVLPSDIPRFVGANDNAFVAPLARAEGHDMRTLGALSTGVDQLAAWARQAAHALPLHEWHAMALAILDAFVDDEDAGVSESATLRQVLADMLEHMDHTGSETPFSLAAFRAWLEQLLMRPRPPRGFLSGGITVCAMMPMRSIPFRVVYVCGMDEARFPRQDISVDLGVFPDDVQLGDRNAREDDRFLFLEAVLSARDAFVAIYDGRDLNKGAVRPPSVVIGELCEVLTSITNTDDVVRTHPLLASAPEAFTRAEDAVPPAAGPAWAHRGALAALGPKTPRPPLLTAPLSIPAPQSASLDDMVRFFKDPPLAFMRQSLAMATYVPEPEQMRRELLLSDGLLDYVLANDLLAPGGEDIVTRDDAWATYAHQLTREGKLPIGEPGVRTARAVRYRALSVWRAARAQGLGTHEAVTGRVKRGGLIVTGTAAGFDAQSEAMWTLSAGSATAKRLIEAWVRLLWMHHVKPGAVRAVMLAGWEHKKAFVRRVGLPNNAAALWAELCALYREGHTAPLPLACRAGQTWAHTVKRRTQEGASEDDAEREAARRASYPRKKDDRAYHDLDVWHRLFGDGRYTEAAGVAGHDFVSLTKAIWVPLLAHTTDVGGAA